MQIAGATLTTQVVLELAISICSNFGIRLISSHADICHTGLRVDVLDQAQPSFPGGRSVSLRGQSNVLYAGHRPGLSPLQSGSKQKRGACLSQTPRGENEDRSDE